VDSLITWGLIKPLIGGADDWQREGNDLSIASKWSPHEYPALDPAKSRIQQEKATAHATRLS